MKIRSEASPSALQLYVYNNNKKLKPSLHIVDTHKLPKECTGWLYHDKIQQSSLSFLFQKPQTEQIFTIYFHNWSQSH